MINKMREMAPTIMLIILVTFVGGTIFLDWGMNVTSKSGMKTTSAGKINGKEIPLSYIDRQVNVERQKLQQQGNVPPYQARMIPQKVWEQEVNRILMQDVFKKMGLDATADEIFEYIKNNPLPGIDTASVFKTNGVFDTSKYVRFLSDPKSYEYYGWLRDIESYTKEMIIPSQKLEQLLQAGAFPTKSEIEYQYNQEKQKLVFEYLKVNSPMISVDESKITDAMMRNYYEAHRDSFATGDQAEIYFVKYPKLATANDDQTYLQEMKDLKGRIESSGKKIAESFAEEAKTESDDEGSAVNGGDLGWFTKGQMVPQFDSIAFSIDTGKISDPVRTQFGYHLILVEAKEVKGDTVKVKARHILRKVVPTNETLDKLSEHADSLKGAILNNGNFLATARAAGVQVDSTGLYKKGDMIPKIGYLSGAGQYVFHHDKKENVSERLENEDAYYLIAIKQIVRKGIMPYEAAREKIRVTLTDSLRQAAAREYAQSVLSKLSDTTSLASLKNSDPKITAGVTDTVAASDYIAGIGYGTKVAAVAKSLPVGKRSNIIDFNGTCYIVRTLWRLPSEKMNWNSPEAAQSVEKVKQQLKQKVYYDWYNDYKNKAKVVSNIENIYVD